jgi:hypothetical protein
MALTEQDKATVCWIVASILEFGRSDRLSTYGAFCGARDDAFTRALGFLRGGGIQFKPELMDSAYPKGTEEESK